MEQIGIGLCFVVFVALIFLALLGRALMKAASEMDDMLEQREEKQNGNH